MKIGVPSEIKAQEFRVGLTPASVQELTNHGHEVLVQDQAGFGAGFDNADYSNAGAKIASITEDIFNGFFNFDNHVGCIKNIFSGRGYFRARI